MAEEVDSTKQGGGEYEGGGGYQAVQRTGCPKKTLVVFFLKGVGRAINGRH